MTVSGLVVAGLGQLEDVLLRQGRSIAGIIPSVVIEEQHTDDLMITQHPVESGADVTDHAVKMPAQVTMSCGFGQSGSNIVGASLFQPSPRDAYNLLLSLQASKQPFDVITGKRSYKNMLVKRLTVVTDQETENVLMVDVELQEIIMVDTSTTGSSSVTVGATAASTSSAQTSPVVNVGTVQPVDITASLTGSQPADIAALVP